MCRWLSRHSQAGKDVVMPVSAGSMPDDYSLFLENLKTLEDRLWYAKKSVENGWSGNILVSRQYPTARTGSVTVWGTD